MKQLTLTELILQEPAPKPEPKPAPKPADEAGEYEAGELSGEPKELKPEPKYRPGIVYSFPKKGEMLVGRYIDSDICLPDRHVSRVHCKIKRVDGDYLIEDKTSRNGTFVNEEPVRNPSGEKLEAGDILRIVNDKFQIGFVEEE